MIEAGKSTGEIVDAIAKAGAGPALTPELRSKLEKGKASPAVLIVLRGTPLTVDDPGRLSGAGASAELRRLLRDKERA